MPGVFCKMPAFDRLLSLSLFWMYASLFLRSTDSNICTFFVCQAKCCTVFVA